MSQYSSVEITDDTVYFSSILKKSEKQIIALLISLWILVNHLTKHWNEIERMEMIKKIFFLYCLIHFISFRFYVFEM